MTKKSRDYQDGFDAGVSTALGEILGILAIKAESWSPWESATQAIAACRKEVTDYLKIYKFNRNLP